MTRSVIRPVPTCRICGNAVKHRTICKECRDDLTPGAFEARSKQRSEARVEGLLAEARKAGRETAYQMGDGARELEKFRQQPARPGLLSVFAELLDLGGLPTSTNCAICGKRKTLQQRRQRKEKRHTGTCSKECELELNQLLKLEKERLPPGLQPVEAAAGPREKFNPIGERLPEPVRTWTPEQIEARNKAEALDPSLRIRPEPVEDFRDEIDRRKDREARERAEARKAKRERQQAKAAREAEREQERERQQRIAAAHQRRERKRKRAGRYRDRKRRERQQAEKRQPPRPRRSPAPRPAGAVQPSSCCEICGEPLPGGRLRTCSHDCASRWTWLTPGQRKARIESNRRQAKELERLAA